MKLRFSICPKLALLAAFTTTVFATNSANADVPQDYTEVLISNASELQPYQKSNYKAFIIKANIINNKYPMRSSYMYWGDASYNTHSLSFEDILVLGSFSSRDSGVNISQMLTMENFKELKFTKNYGAFQHIAAFSYTGGGAIYAGGGLGVGDATGSVNLRGNKNIIFSENTADYGGAILAGTFNVIDNGNVSFNGNQGSLVGGALEVKAIAITGNENVAFTGNHTCYKGGGGAIFTNSLEISNNGVVEFRGNYEKIEKGGELLYRLSSIQAEAGPLTLSAANGQSIIFYDALQAGEKAIVSFNADYVDQNGEKHSSSGDIVFSGKYAKQDLASLKTSYTQKELEDSLTTEVSAITNLYGGRLRIEDGAVYKGNGISVASNSNATLSIAGAVLDQTGHEVNLGSGNNLNLHGDNNITASILNLQNGCAISFNLGSEKRVLLSLDAILQTRELTISLNGDLTLNHNLISLSDATLYDTSAWTKEKVTVIGSDFDHLYWNKGVLVYTPEELQHITLDSDTEIDGFNEGARIDVEGNGHTLTVKHPVDLVQLALKSGTIRLNGDNNNVVHVTISKDGSLELAVGAGMSVGNIMNMVANGSANLVISGDIEINDIKAYGKPGNKGTLSYANMTIVDDYSIENMNIDGSYIKLAEGTTLYIKNVNISADSRITDDSARLFIEGGEAILDADNTEVSVPTVSLADVTFYRAGDTETWMTLRKNVSLVSLNSELISRVILTGTDLWLDMTGLAAKVGDAAAFSLSFAEGAVFDVDNLCVFATLDGVNYLQGYATQQHGTTTTLYFSEQIPEPTTSTLSLLALAGLCARRRKK